VPLTRDDLEACADDVRRYWGSHLHVEVSGEGRPRTNWRTVYVPPGYRSWSREHLLAILLHEWGHRMISPISPERGAIWRTAAQREGLSQQQAHLVVNLATDAWIDRHYLTSSDWGPVYWRGECESLNTTNGAAGPSDEPSLPAVIRIFYARLLREMRPATGDTEALFTPVQERIDAAAPEMTKLVDDLWDILYDRSREKPDRIRAVARRLRDLLPEQSAGLASPAHQFEVGPDTELTPALRREAKRAGLSDPEVDDLFGDASMTELRQRADRLELYEEVVPVVEAFMSRRARSRREGYEKWKVGQPLRDLDLLATLQRSSALLPGVTTLSPHYETQGPKSAGQGCGRLVLVIDDSGSTTGSTLRREQEAAFAITAAARRLEDAVGCVVFGSGVTESIAPTSQYTRIEEAVCRLTSSSGGTQLGPALTEALDFLTPPGEGALMLMSDAAFHDEQAVVDRLTHLPAEVQCAAFCFGDEADIRDTFARADTSQLAVYAASPDEPFTETALQELYGLS
jgi:hypothetical protein